MTDRAAPLSVSTPTEGHYRVQLARGSVWSPCKIWFGPPSDPLTGELLDRSHRWQATVRGRPYARDAIELWIWCAGNPIAASEYHYLMALHAHAAEHDPEAPEASPREPIDHMTQKPIF